MPRADTPNHLPDILAPGLSVVFCGINPGLCAAATGHHFAGRGNRFWRTLYLAGFTPELLRAEDDRSLLLHACGSTAAVARPTARAQHLSRAEIRTAAPEFERKIAQYAPRYIAFLGKMAASELIGKREIEWGPQPQTFGGARIWVLPNPSGLNRAFSQDALVSAYRELRLAAASMHAAA
ncbi:G/U mismatch-specific DNA glycosylase [Paraburkholderia phymatum]|uniref:Uracil-DNA glycosylase superfamily n=1 Tax=Paraburkholderia phymatum (strain DSM 17167 / CIP 108236 / LMG 21445 / STM815) TaxID=391038 RepID=B2JLC6_PARP8|nr:G/U mismatch-specific DNA glycosylase [Paraburkholderia phymatum]ACC74094.1 Uracil-DNA glycosylase superfamily [Paraburkholderia phymatum STM815]